MNKHLTVDDIRKAITEGRVDYMPGRSRHNKLPKSIEGDPNDYLRFVIKGHEGRDAVAKFEPEQLKKWGNPPKFELLFPQDNEDCVVLMSRNAESTGHGIFTITQTRPTRQGSTTMTWAGLRRKLPPDKSVGDSIFVPVVLLDSEFLVINVSALERLEL